MSNKSTYLPTDDKIFLLKEIKNSSKVLITNSDKTTYKFDILPFGERGSYLSNRLINVLRKGLVNMWNSLEDTNNVDYILTTDPNNQVWAILLAQAVGKDVNIVRENSSGLPGEIEIIKLRAYHKTSSYLQNIKKQDNVVILEDVISSGGTVDALIKTLNKINVKITSILSIYTKTDSYLALEKKYSVDIKSLVNYND